MLIKSTLIAAAAAIAFSGAAIADEAKGPRVMTDSEMGAIVAGGSSLAELVSRNFFQAVANSDDGACSGPKSCIGFDEAYSTTYGNPADPSPPNYP